MGAHRKTLLADPNERRINLYIACEQMNFFWSERQVSKFKQLWDSGESIQSIAKHFKRDPDEVGLLVIDQAKKGNIKTQCEPAEKGQSHKVIATVEKMKKETPTVITIHGMRYVLEHPNQGRAKK